MRRHKSSIDVVRGIGIVESSKSRREDKVHDAGRTVTLLGNDELRFGLFFLRHLLIAIVVTVAMDEGDHVCVLLNGA